MLPEATEDGTPITSIGASVFKGNTSIKNVIFPSSYTTLPTYAFANSALISVDLSKTQITEIPDYAFYCANLTAISLPEGLIKIGKCGFYDSTLPSITFPESLQIIGDYAFRYNNNMKSIFITKNVSYIGTQFLIAGALQQIVVDEDNVNFYDIEDSVLASYSGDLIIVASQSNLTSLTITDDITKLRDFSLYAVSKIKSIIIGKNLSTIENNAFNNFTGLQTISVDSNNTSFASENDNTLYNKSKTQLYLVTSTLTSFTMPDSLTTIADFSVFNPIQSTLQYVTLNNTISDIQSLYRCSKIIKMTVPAENTNFKADSRAVFSSDDKTIIKYFGGNSATTYTVPEEVTKVDIGCFYGSILQTISLPENLSTIGDYAFRMAQSLNSINIPNSVTTIGNYAFSYTKLTSFVVSSNVTSIGYHVFASATSLTSIEFHNTVIPPYASYYCISLKTVIVGENVTYINFYAFQYCKALESVEFQGTTPPTLDSSNVFLNTNSTFKIYVPDSAVNTYKSAQYFSQYASQIYPISSKA